MDPLGAKLKKQSLFSDLLRESEENKKGQRKKLGKDVVDFKRSLTFSVIPWGAMESEWYHGIIPLMGQSFCGARMW